MGELDLAALEKRFPFIRWPRSCLNDIACALQDCVNEIERLRASEKRLDQFLIAANVAQQVAYPTDRTVRIVEVYDAYNGKPQPRLPDPGRRS